ATVRMARRGTREPSAGRSALPQHLPPEKVGSPSPWRRHIWSQWSWYKRETGTMPTLRRGRKMTKCTSCFILLASLYAAVVAAQEPEQKLTMPGPEIQNLMLGKWSIKVHYPSSEKPNGDT